MYRVTESLICLIDSNTILQQKLLAACKIADSSIGKESRWDWNTLFLPESLERTSLESQMAFWPLIL